MLALPMNNEIILVLVDKVEEIRKLLLLNISNYQVVHKKALVL